MRYVRTAGKRVKEPEKKGKLNIKKIVALILAIAVVVMVFFIVKNILKKDKQVHTQEANESYFSSYENNKWGVINSKGEDVISPSYEELIVIPNNKKDVFIVTYGVNYETGEYSTKALNSKSEELFTEYQQIEALSNFDENGVMWYENNLLKVKQDDKYGLIDLEGNEILPKEYEEITPVNQQENAFKIKKDDQEKIIDRQGNEIQLEEKEEETLTNPNYEEVTEAGENNLIAKKEGKYGITDLEGKELVPFESTSITYNKDAKIFILEDEAYNAKILDENLEQKLEGIFLDIDTEKNYIKMRVGEDYKYYNFQFEEEPVTEIFKENTLFMKKENGKYGFVNSQGEQVVECKYDDATEQNAEGFAGIKENGKWGSIDKNGEVVIEPTYNLDEYLLVDFIGKWHKGPDLNMQYYCKD